jgi:hypothetical protein
MRKINKKSQIWIETVIYTVMALTIIGIVLGIVKPALDERKDAVSVKDSINVLNDIDSTINEIKFTPGNSRTIDVKITRGNLIVDGEKSQVRLVIEESKYAPSQPGLVTHEGNVVEITNSSGKQYTVTLILDYSGKFNITYQGKNQIKTFQYAPTPYNMAIKNNGGAIFNIDFF